MTLASPLARWQHPAMGRGAKFNMPGTTGFICVNDARLVLRIKNRLKCSQMRQRNVNVLVAFRTEYIQMAGLIARWPCNQTLPEASSYLPLCCGVSSTGGWYSSGSSSSRALPVRQVDAFTDVIGFASASLTAMLF